MIIDEPMLVALGACQEAVDWFRDNGFYGQTRGQFMRATQTATDAGLIPDYYFPWLAEHLFKSPVAIKRVPHTVDPVFRITGPEADDTATYATKADAKAAMIAARQAHHQKYAYLHHVIARIPTKANDGSVEARSLGLNNPNPPNRATSFDAFNLYTGLYESFNSYDMAVARAIELRDQFRAGIDASFRVYQQVTETETAQTALDEVLAP